MSRVDDYFNKNFDREVHEFPGASTTVIYKKKKNDATDTDEPVQRVSRRGMLAILFAIFFGR